MSELNIAVLLLVACFFWIITRSLRDCHILLRVIIIGIISIIFFSPIIGEGLFTGAGLFLQAIIFTLAFFMLIYLNLKNPATICIGSIDKSFMMFILFLCLSFFFSINKKASIDQILYFISLYLLFWTIKNLPEDRRIKSLFLKSLGLCCLVLLIYAVYQYKIGFSAMREFLKTNPEYFINSAEFIKRLNQNTVFATFIYPPAFGGYLTMLFLVLIGGYFQIESNLFKSKYRIVNKLFILAACLFILPILIMTKSKGAWLALISAAAVFFALSKKNKTQKIAILSATAIALIASGLSFLLLDIEMPKTANFLFSYQIRAEYWKATGMMILKRPLFGFGPGSFGIAYPLFKTLLAEETIMAHNSFLQVWAESGIFAFISFIIFCLIFLGKGLKQATAMKGIQLGLYCSFISFLVQNMVDFGLFDAQRAITAFSILGIFYLSFCEKEELVIPDRKRRLILLIAGTSLFLGVIAYSSTAYLAILFDKKAAQAYKQNNLQKAAEFSAKAINLSHLTGEFYFHRAIIFEKASLNSSDMRHTEYINEALKNYRQAIRLNPFIAHYHFSLAKLLLATGKEANKQEVQVHLKKAVSLYPVNPFYHEQLAAFYDIIGDKDKAKQSWEQAQELKKYYKKGTK